MEPPVWCFGDLIFIIRQDLPPWRSRSAPPIRTHPEGLIAASAPRGCGVHPGVRHGSCQGACAAVLVQVCSGGNGARSIPESSLWRGVRMHGYSLNGADPSLCLSAVSIAKAQTSLPLPLPPPLPHGFQSMGDCFRQPESCVHPGTAHTAPVVLPLTLNWPKCGVWLCLLSFCLVFETLLSSTRRTKLCGV